MTNKVTTWVLIMALLISQSYAYAFAPCESNAHASRQHVDDMGSISLGPKIHSPLEAEITNHMQHNMQLDMQQDMAMDCCDQECSCLTGTCASVTFTQFITITSVNAVSNSSVFYLFSIQDAFLPSLRRPPIIS